MDLFTYLLAKNGSNSAVHGDLFSYLLGKSQSKIYTATGTTINIPDAKKLVSLIMTKESTQETTTGKNLINILYFLDTQEKVYTRNGVTATINNNGTITLNGTATANSDFYFNLLTINGENKKLVINNSVGTFSGNTSFWAYGLNFDNSIHADISSATSNTINLNAAEYRRFEIYVRNGNTYNNAIFELMVVDTSVTDLSYEEYTGGIPSPNPDYPQEVKTVKGSVDVYVSNGETTNTYTINLGNNELVGIGDYKDELLVDKSGHVFINKKCGKIILNGTENWIKQDFGNNLYIYGFNEIKQDNAVIVVYSNCFLGVSYSNRTLEIQNIIYGNSIAGIAIRNVEFNDTDTLKTWLSTQYNNGNPVIVYYVLAQENLIDLQTTVDLSLFKGANTITNSEDGYMTIQYR